MRRAAICVIVLLVFAVGCKKSVKGEESRWKSANQTVDELSVLYPGFKGALEEQRGKAKAVMAEAEKLTGEKERIAKMSSANSLLTTGFVPQLKEVDTKKKAIEQRIIEVTAGASDMADRASAQQAADSAKKTVAQVDGLLRAGAADAKTAGVIVKKAVEDLDAAERLLGTAANLAQQKKAPPPSTGAGAGAAAGTAPATTQPAAQKWTCDHCDHVNDADAETCANCGAPRPAK